ncbi:hypothetical protein DCAR_0205298 [Daucus carota subsp. sativus]|uniref:DUF4218 domain-containing protein n=1 Tax=Daucus carota subsp. sativus TaxID=79200 RepID=A0AAF1AN36_DAUCS|nr:hypothetical protein DCAR_0205298 [Daucus carota subsp. sativus]
MKKLQEDIVDILCNLEIIFPSAFFDVMIHLLVHLCREIEYGGPEHLRNMFGIERYLAKLKSYVRNRSKPEGSIAEGYLAKECVTFCNRFLDDDGAAEKIDGSFPTQQIIFWDVIDVYFCFFHSYLLNVIYFCSQCLFSFKSLFYYSYFDVVFQMEELGVKKLAAVMKPCASNKRKGKDKVQEGGDDYNPEDESEDTSVETTEVIKYIMSYYT